MSLANKLVSGVYAYPSRPIVRSLALSGTWAIVEWTDLKHAGGEFIARREGGKKWRIVRNGGGILSARDLASEGIPAQTARYLVSNLRPPVGSGIAGQIFLGPVCPVERLDSPCPERPYQATVAIRLTNGREVAQVRADASGHFQVALKPGTYVLHPLSERVMPRGIDQTITVKTNAYTTVRVEYDSGIR